MAIRVYTRHGLRAHYTPGGFLAPNNGRYRRARTYCDHDAYRIDERSRLFRRRLVQASVCRECDEAQNVADAAR